MYYTNSTVKQSEVKKIMDYNFSDNLPIYIQIMNIIKLDIVVKKLNSGDKLPSVREMSVNFRVNPNTIQRVYQELEREGITYTQRGMGTFVKEDNVMNQKLKKEMAEDIINTFVDGMTKLGFSGKEIIDIVSEKVNKAAAV